MKSKLFECLNDVWFDYFKTLVDGYGFDDEDRSPKGVMDVLRKASYSRRQDVTGVPGP
jgi:hypothetical protein